MENATKALLIAAAVLIVILVIALGMRIFNSTSGAAKDASQAGGTISNSTSSATNMAVNQFTDIMTGLQATN